MGHDLTRRALLSATPALLAPAVLTAAPAFPPAPADPLPALLAEWRRARGEWQRVLEDAGDDTPLSEALWAERSRLDALIMGTVATSPEGLRAQFEYMAEETLEAGTFCAMPEHMAAPFVDVFRAGFRRLAA